MDPTGDAWVEAVKAATGGSGVDLVVDQISGPGFDVTMRATKIKGRIVNVGRLGGNSAPVDFNLHALRRITYTGVTFRSRSLAEICEIVQLAQADLSGRVSGGGASVVVPGNTNPRGATVEVQRGDNVLRGRIDNTRSLNADDNTQTLQVLEGSSGFIRAGQSVPVPQRQVVRTIVNGQVVERVGNAVEYRDVTSGFYVLPRLAGDRVTLEINPQRDTLARPEQNLPSGSVNVQQAATTVSGRLGEWMEIGGVAHSASNQQSTILGSTRETSSDNRRILLKVDEIR